AGACRRRSRSDGARSLLVQVLDVGAARRLRRHRAALRARLALRKSREPFGEQPRALSPRRADRNRLCRRFLPHYRSLRAQRQTSGIRRGASLLSAAPILLVFAIFAVLMYLRWVPALVAVPAMAVAMSLVAGVPPAKLGEIVSG